MVNNFEQIKGLLSFPSDDIFYFCQILKRKKEHPELGSNSYVVKTYYIKKLEELDFYKDEMICLAEHHNARVYISLNQRSFERTAFQSLKKTADQIMNKDFKSVRKGYSSVCGMYAAGDTTWIVDIDFDPIPENASLVDKMKPLQIINNLKMNIHNLQPVGEKLIATIPTKNGVHLITKPFRLDTFKEKYPDIDVHKNNPTLLFCPD